MRDAFEMWRSTRMVVLAALSAALYAALLIPFKAIVLIPGLTEVRPASALPVVLALLFGPAAAWGAAFGNLIGDFFGTLTPGSLFGLLGNFLFAYVPYRLWTVLSPRQEGRGALRQLPLFVFVSLAGACSCAIVIAWGVDLLGMAPYHVLGVIISLNNAVPTLALGAALLPLLYHRSRRWGLLVGQNLASADTAPGPLAGLGALLILAGDVAGVALAVLIFRLPPGQAPPSWIMLFGSPRNLAGICAAMIVLGAALTTRAPRYRVRRREPAPTASAGPAAAVPGAPALQLDALRFSYPGQTRPALADVSLAVAPGEWLTVLGPTGAGKSTLCLTLCGVIPHLQGGEFAGEVVVGGTRTRETPVHDLAAHLGTLFQHFESQLVCSDVRSEVAFALEQRGLPREEMKRRVEQALQAVGLDELAARDPAALSGGQQQRLALAAVLAAEPELLVLDEPTTDLDPQGRRELMTTLAGLRTAGKTLVVVENDLWPPQPGEMVAVLGEGRLRALAPAEELLADPAACRELGLRPLPLPDLCERLGAARRPLSVDDAVAFAAEQGWSLDGPAWAELVATERGAADPQAPVLLSVENVTYSYGDHPVLSGVSLQVREGEFVAVIGPNGAGKTTLARHLNGLLKPSGGRVTVAGQDTAAATPAELARTVGYLFQDPDDGIFCQTVAAEVAFGVRGRLPEEEIAPRVQEALEWVGLAHAADADPFALTRGERQQVALAAVLALRPQVIVVDEPTTGLDGAEQERMLQRLRQLNEQGHTIVMVTHATWAAAAYARRLVLLGEGGVILADGSPREVYAEETLLQQAHQVAPEIVQFSRRAFGRVLLSVEEATACVRGSGAGTSVKAEPDRRQAT